MVVEFTAKTKNEKRDAGFSEHCWGVRLVVRGRG